MEDAQECLEAILNWLHVHQLYVPDKNVIEFHEMEDTICNPPCISHAVFGLQTCDIVCTRVLCFLVSLSFIFFPSLFSFFLSFLQLALNLTGKVQPVRN